MRRKPPKSMFQITGSILALPGIVDAMAKAVYQTHIPKAKLNRDRVPSWEQASSPVREYAMAQAEAAATVVDEYRAVMRRKRPPREPGPVAGNAALIEHIARAIHRTHQGTLPGWTEVTEDMRNWHRQYALSAARVVDEFIAQHGKDWHNFPTPDQASVPALKFTAPVLAPIR